VAGTCPQRTKLFATPSGARMEGALGVVAGHFLLARAWPVEGEGPDPRLKGHGAAVACAEGRAFPPSITQGVPLSSPPLASPF